MKRHIFKVVILLACCVIPAVAQQNPNSLGAILNHYATAQGNFIAGAIPKADLDIIIQAGVRAPSARNLQPWHFTVVQKKSLLDRINVKAREVIKKVFPVQSETMPWIVAPNYNYFYDAPTVIFISGQMDNEDVLGDCAIALMNMVYAAESLELQTCVVTTGLAAFTTEAGAGFMEDLEIPEGFKPIYALVLGYTSKPLPMAAPRKENFVNFIR